MAEGWKRHGTGYQVRLTLAGGKRVSPTLRLKQTALNDKAVARMAREMRQKITAGTFNLSEEFPDYRNAVLTGDVTFKQAAEQYLKLYGPDLAHSTKLEYESALRVHWYGVLGDVAIARIDDEKILGIRSDRVFHPKTWNNILTPVRRVFDYALEKKWITANPLAFIKNRKLQKPSPDPLDVIEVDTALASIEKLFGIHARLYYEFAIAEGLRTEELIALKWEHVGLAKGEIKISEALTRGEIKETKTYTERTIKLSPRGRAVVERCRGLSELAGKNLFVDPVTGEGHPTYHKLSKQWLRGLKAAKVRHRKAYTTRQTSVSWRLMIGENVMKVAKHHGHSVQTMLSNYAKWIDTEDEQEVERIKAWLGHGVQLLKEKAA